MTSIDIVSTQPQYLTPHTCAHCQKINLCGDKQEIWIADSGLNSWDTPNGNQWHLFHHMDMSFTGICLDDLEKGSHDGCRLAEYLRPRISEGFPKHLSSQELRIYTTFNTFYGLYPLKKIFSSGQELVFGFESVQNISSDSRTDHCYVVVSAQYKPFISGHGIKYRLTAAEGKLSL